MDLLLLEIDRMREIMGINILSENQKIDIKRQYLLESLMPNPVMDEVAEPVLKYLGLEGLWKKASAKGDKYAKYFKNFGETLEKNLGDPARIRQQIMDSSPGKYTDPNAIPKDLIDASIGLYLKNHPELVKAIIKEIPGIEQKIIKDIDLSKILDDDTIKSINKVRDLDPRDLATFRDDIKEISDLLKGTYQENRPTEIQNLIDGFDNQVKAIDDITNPKNITDKLKVPDNTPEIKSKTEIDAEVKTNTPKEEKTPIEKLFSGNSNIKKSFQGFVRRVLYSTNDKNLKVWTIEDLKITKEIEDFLNIYDSKFLENVKNKKYRSLFETKVDEQGNLYDDWTQINMLDSNNKDGKAYLNSLLERFEGKTSDDVSEEELKTFINKLNTLSDAEIKAEHKFLMDNKETFTTKSTEYAKTGDIIEEYAIENVINNVNAIGKDFTIVYHAGADKGNPIDTILGIDIILKDRSGNLVPVQVKSTGSINVKPSKVEIGQDSFEFWLTTPIRLRGDDAYGLVLDKKGNYIMFKPQNQYTKSKETDEWVIIGKGFNRRNINYVDINKDGKYDFMTNIDFSKTN